MAVRCSSAELSTIARAAVLTMTMSALASPLHAQTVTTTVQADPASLGPIPDGSGGVCASVESSRVVTFPVDIVGPVVGVTVSLTFNPRHSAGGQLTATLVAPDGTAHLLFGRPGARRLGCGTTADLAGPYTFSDSASGNFWQAAAASVTIVPGGTYRTTTAGSLQDGGVPTSMDTTFSGRLAPGQWRLVVSDAAGGDTGAVSAATLTITTLTTISATPASLVTVPAVACPADGPLPTSRDIRFDVAGQRGTIGSLSVGVAANQLFAEFQTAELIAPGGVVTHLLFPGSRSASGSATQMDGAYEFGDRASGDWLSARVSGAVVPPGAFRTIGSLLTATSMDAAFAGRSPNGTWTLRWTNCKVPTGSITGAQLSIVTAVDSPPEQYGVEANTTLSIPAPGVLANDDGAGPLTAAVGTAPTRGTLTLAADGGFSYSPSPGFVGSDRFEYRATSVGVTGPLTTVTIDVTPPLARPPSNVEVVNVVGSRALLRWDPPVVGPSPTAFDLTAGAVPGQVLARVPLPVNPPVFEVDAPPGIFFLRLTTQSAVGASAPSADARLSVGVPDPPSAPTSLTGLVNGDVLTLHWKETFAGGAPTGAILDVSGSFTGSLPVGPGGAFTFRGVPPGTYTFAVRGANGSGVSGASNPVTLTFPGACSGPPAAPTRFLAFARGSTVTLLWDPPTSGPAPDRYELHVSGSFTGAFPMGPRRLLSTPAPPGTYSISVSASNPCGTSALTSAAVVSVP